MFFYSSIKSLFSLSEFVVRVTIMKLNLILGVNLDEDAKTKIKLITLGNF